MSTMEVIREATTVALETQATVPDVCENEVTVGKDGWYCDGHAHGSVTICSTLLLGCATDLMTIPTGKMCSKFGMDVTGEHL